MFLAAANGLRAPRGRGSAKAPLTGRELAPSFEAVVDASEEAVVNCLLSAHDVTGVGGKTIPALPRDAVAELLDRHYAGPRA